MKRWCLILVLSFIAGALTSKRTPGFCLKKIEGSHAFNSAYQVEEPSGLNEIFNQSYSYLGSGKECYAFVSADNRFVIKFFKQKHLTLKPWHTLFPSLFEKTISRRQKLREKCCTSALIAYRELQESTGVVYLHLNTTQHLKRHLKIFDQHHNSHEISLDRFEFLVQRKATPILAFLDTCAMQDDWERIDKIVAAIPEFIRKRYEKGIDDSDLNCSRNLGVIDDQIISIDVGEFKKALPLKSLDESIEEATRDLREWLETQKAFPKRMNESIAHPLTFKTATQSCDRSVK